MCGADADYPGFGFAENVGYSTPEHRDAVLELGPSELHRRSFQSIAYSQLALDGHLADVELERAADVLELEDSIGGVEAQADHVEAKLAESG